MPDSFAFDEVAAVAWTAEGDHRLAGLWHPTGKGVALAPNPDALLVLGPDGTPQWGADEPGAASLDAAGRRVALLTTSRLRGLVLGYRLVVIRLSDGLPLCEHLLPGLSTVGARPRLRVAWAGEGALLAAALERTEAQAHRIVLPDGSTTSAAFEPGRRDFPRMLAGLGVAASDPERAAFADALDALTGPPPTSEATGPAVALPGVRVVAASRDGAVTAAAAGGLALVWSERSRPGVLRSPWPQFGVRDVAVSGGGVTAVAAGIRAQLRDRDGRKLGRLVPETGQVVRVAGCPAHDRFALADHDGRVFVYDEQHQPIGKVRCVEAGNGRLTGLAWHPDGRLIAAGSASGELMIIDGVTAKPRRGFDIREPVRDLWFLDAPSGVRLLVWTVDGNLGMLGCGDADRGRGGSSRGTLEPWLHDPTISAVAVHADGRRVALGHDDGSVRVMTIGDAEGHDLPRHFGPVRALAWTTDHLLVGAGRRDRPGSVHSYRAELKEI